MKVYFRFLIMTASVKYKLVRAILFEVHFSVKLQMVEPSADTAVAKGVINCTCSL